MYRQNRANTQAAVEPLRPRLGTYLELGPHPVLVGSISEHLKANGEAAEAIATLRRSQPEQKTLLGSLGHLHVKGYHVSWNVLYPHPTPPMPLPGYPYQRQRFWFERRATPQNAAASEAARTIFEPAWRPVERGARLQSPRGPWIVAGGDHVSRENLAAALRLHDVSVTSLHAADWFKSGGEASGLIWLADELSGENPAAACQNVLLSGMTALQDLIRRPSLPPMRFWLVTRSAVATPAAPSCDCLSQSPLWGMLRSVAMEHPELSCVRVDLEAAVPTFDALAEEVARWDGEEEIAFHGGQRYAPRLEAKPIAAAMRPVPPVRDDATYLITGGLGAIGLSCLEWLAAKGARTLVLLGRRGPTAEVEKRIDGLRTQGKRVEIRSADVSDAGQMRAVLEEIERTMPPLRGIFHAAGVLDDGVFRDQTGQRIERVLAPKASGAWNLHQLIGDRPLDFFVLFSSVASLTGSPGQSGYAAANAFLDALAHYRRTRGLAALSVNWGAWAGSGMAEHVAEGGSAVCCRACGP